MTCTVRTAVPAEETKRKASKRSAAFFDEDSENRDAYMQSEDKSCVKSPSRHNRDNQTNQKRQRSPPYVVASTAIAGSQTAVSQTQWTQSQTTTVTKLTTSSSRLTRSQHNTAPTRREYGTSQSYRDRGTQDRRAVMPVASPREQESYSYQSDDGDDDMTQPLLFGC